MAHLTDIHGKQYHMESWHADARTARESKKMLADAFDADPQSPVGMRRVLVNEANEKVTTLIDVGTHLYVPQENGTYTIEKLVPANEPETET